MASGSGSRRSEALTLLIVGNSVSLPPAAGIDAYPERVALRLGDSWRTDTILRSGATVEEMEADVLAALVAQPDYLVLQVGINECAPRPLGVGERAWLGRLRPLRLRQLLIRVIHHLRPHIIRLRPLQQFTPLPRFVSSVRRIVMQAAAGGTRVLVLPITRVTAEAERRTPFTNREVARYNDALAPLASTLVHVASNEAIFGEAGPDTLCHTPETVHLSAAAHDAISDYILRWLGPAAAGAGQ